MIEKLNEYGTLMSIVSLFIGILGVVLAFYFYFKSKKTRKPYFSRRSFNVISERVEKYSDLKVTFRNEVIKNLTVTKIAIWNGGNETINYSDLAATDKIYIKADEDFSIFNAEILFQTNDTCQFKLNQNNKQVDIDFDYIDKNQGCILQIIHSGRKSSDLIVQGTVKGCGSIKENRANTFDLAITNIVFVAALPLLRSSKKDKRFLTRLLPWSIFIAGIGLTSVYFFLDSSKPDRIAFLVLGGLYALLGLALVFRRNPIPKTFEKFYEDE